MEGVDINLKGGEWENTALHVAAFKGHLKTVQLLAGSKGIDLWARNKVFQVLGCL